MIKASYTAGAQSNRNHKADRFSLSPTQTRTHAEEPGSNGSGVLRHANSRITRKIYQQAVDEEKRREGGSEQAFVDLPHEVLECLGNHMKEGNYHRHKPYCF